MSELFVLLKIAAVVVGLIITIVGLVSFALWQNPFRHIKPIYAGRCILALIVYCWLLYFLVESAG